MSNSERATASIREMPERDRPLSEQFRVVAKEWVALDGAARMLESCKDAVLSQMIKRQGDVPVARAEREAKAGPDWDEYVRKMVAGRTAANLKKVQMEYLRMKHMEETSMAANFRHEARLSK